MQFELARLFTLILILFRLLPIPVDAEFLRARN